MTNDTSIQPISVVIAGSTHHTLLCAQSLHENGAFRISGIITPAPKPQGRKKEIKENPLHVFAKKNAIPTVLIEKKIDERVHEQLTAENERPDVLLVVDFGFLVPTWLLTWPRVAPINIHPSDLPKFRGSSPGQFTLLFGEKTSAITLIVMDEKLDHGPILSKVFFDVDPTWTAHSYYSHAFSLISRELPKLIMEFMKHPTETSVQPDVSPTPTARMLTREDGFVSLQALQQILTSGTTNIHISLLALYGITPSALSLYNMWRALTPWPGLWTIVNKGNRETRVKILDASFENDLFKIRQIQLEGKTPQAYKKSEFGLV